MGNIAEVNTFNGFKAHTVDLTSFLDSNAESLACPLNTKFSEGKPSLLLCKSLSKNLCPSLQTCPAVLLDLSQDSVYVSGKHDQQLPLLSHCPSLQLRRESCFGWQHCWTLSVVKPVGHHVSWGVDLHVCLRVSKAVWMP